MTFPADFRNLTHKAKHEVLREFAGAKADAAPEGSASQQRWDDIAWSENGYLEAIDRQEARVAR